MNEGACGVKTLRPNLKIIEGSQRAAPTVCIHAGGGRAGMIRSNRQEVTAGWLWKRLIVSVKTPTATSEQRGVAVSNQELEVSLRMP